jgi:protein gp37
MGENSKIEWTHHTFNPWVGCTKISPACDHCYAEGWAKRSGRVKWGGERKRTSTSYWRQPLKWDAAAKAAGIRQRVFCASLADVFDNQVPDAWRAGLFYLISHTTNLDWLLLTKRIGNARQMLEHANPGGWSFDTMPNVWIGATVANQEEADRDIPKLLATPARTRFLSMEPLLGAVDLRLPYNVGIDLVIAGGESGPGARPLDPRWVQSLRDQCVEELVAFHFKQWGEWLPYMQGTAYMESFRKVAVSTPDGGPADRNGWPMYLVGKEKAGRLLDGRTWDEMPRPTA